ncbi:MAG: cell division protein FtsQ/DivIB [Pseudomonadota bacterium]
MRPLSAESRSMASQSPLPDPAPSRLAYRMERLWLRPAIRKFCRIGLPMIAISGVIGTWASDPANIRVVTDWASEIRRQIETRPEFQVNVIGVEGASPALADEIRIVLGIDLPVSSFDLDLDMLRARIAALPGVAEADLRVRGGGYLAVTIAERQPALVWQTRGGPVLIDETGAFVAALQDRPGAPVLPQVAGEGADLAAEQALALLQSAQALRHDVRGLVRIGERRWDLVLDDARRIQLPSHGAESALDRLIALDVAQDILGRDVLRVDMRNPERLSLQLRPHALEELRRMREFELQGLGDRRG